MQGFNNPAVLAVSAAGLISALLLLCALRGLPFGGALLWLTPLPIFAAGLAFGPARAWFAVAVGAAVVVFGSGMAGMGFYLSLFALPAAVLVSLFLRPGGKSLSMPVAVLGLYPAIILLALTVYFADAGGFEAVLRSAVEHGTRRMGLALPDTVLDIVVRVQAAAIGFWLALLCIGNAALAQGFLVRRGLALSSWPDLADAQMPVWYLGLLLLAGAGFAVASGAVTLSLLLMLLVPFFLMGIASIHKRLRGRGQRTWFLVAFYTLMVIFMHIMAPAMVGMGLYEQWARRAVPPPQT